MPAQGGETTLAVAPARGVYTNLTIASRRRARVIAELGERDQPGRSRAGRPRRQERTARSRRSPRRRPRRSTGSRRSTSSFTEIRRPPDPQHDRPAAELRPGAEVSAARRDPRRRGEHVARPDHAALELSPPRQARLRRPADELHADRRDSARRSRARFSTIRSPVPASDVNEAADEAIKRFPFIDATRQVAGGASYGGHLANWLEAHDDPLQGHREPRGRGEHRSAVGHERQHLPSRADDGRAAVGTGEAVDRSESDPQGGELQDADPAVGRRKRLPRAASTTRWRTGARSSG